MFHNFAILPFQDIIYLIITQWKILEVSFILDRILILFFNARK